MKVSKILAILLALISLSLPACDRMQAEPKGEGNQEQQKIVITSPLAKDVFITQQYVCQISSQRNIEVCALAAGFLMEIKIAEGQAVEKDQVLFEILPTLYEAKYAAEKSEYEFAEQEYKNSKALADDTSKIVSQKEVKLYESKMNKAKFRMEQAHAELKFTKVKAPFAGIVDRQLKQQGSKIREEDVLTTLYDNSLMWVHFNVPEARYLDYMESWSKTSQNKGKSRIELIDSTIELVLANGSTFKHSAGNIVTVEGKFNNETGNIAFRADFPNPEGLLRHGQTGTVLIRRKLPNAIVIPQRAVFEILDKRYVWVVGEDEKVHQREIEVQHEMDDIFVIKKNIDVNDRIVFEGVRQVHDGQKLESFEYLKPEEALKNLKKHAE